MHYHKKTNEKYTVSFNANNGTQAVQVVYEKDKTFNFPTDPLKEGHTFNGWFVDNETFEIPFNQNYISTIGITKNMTVYAKWTVVSTGDGNNEPLEIDENDFDQHLSQIISNSSNKFMEEGYVSVDYIFNMSALNMTDGLEDSNNEDIYVVKQMLPTLENAKLIFSLAFGA